MQTDLEIMFEDFLSEYEIDTELTFNGMLFEVFAAGFEAAIQYIEAGADEDEVEEEDS